MVIVVGTSHTIQREELKLKPFLERLCQEFKVRGIAEEMSEEALSEKSCSASIPMQAANALEIPHWFCDPNREERDKLGIRQETDFRTREQYSQLSDPEIRLLVVESDRKRERYWLEELNDFNVWPVLFVCGADHVTSFRQLLDQQGIAAHVEVEDWTTDSTGGTQAAETLPLRPSPS